MAYVGFLTLTFAENLTDRREAQKRFNSLASNFLRDAIPEHIAAVERQLRGAIHYHLVCGFDYDIRTGFDFETCSLANQAKREGRFDDQRRLQGEAFKTANANLRMWWRQMREAAPRYGFGRSETLPILSTGEALARYVGTYVSTEFHARRPEDKGMRTIRYSLESRAATIRWAWAKGTGATWRRGCQALSLLLGIDDEGIQRVFGKRWAWHLREPISKLGRHYEEALATLLLGVGENGVFPDQATRLRAFAEAIRKWEIDRCSELVRSCDV